MRLFLYYALHSFKNQIKKLFKTWVLVFILICFLFGAGIGLGVEFLAEEADIDDSSYSEEYEEEPIENEIILPEDIKNPKKEFTELIAGSAAVLVLFLFAFSADKSGNAIFLPADVNLLFPAPLKPQSVLMFRLMTQIGTIILSSLYISFNIPNLVFNLGLSVWAAVGFIIALLSLMLIGKLLQVLIYLIASVKPFIKKNLRFILFGVLFLIAGAFYVYLKAQNAQSFDDYLIYAIRFFNHHATRFIPLIGCTKAFCVHIVEGNLLLCLISFTGIIISCVILLFIIGKIKADFYEEALAKSQETAELQAVAAEQTTGFVKRKKDRSDSLKRDKLSKGFGSNIFFYRAMYNRFRFAHFGVFTKTGETYLLIAVSVILLCKFVFEANGFIATMLIIGGFAFFRTLGNPLEEDTSKDFFRLIPENTMHKLFWSVAGGSVNCLLDLIPAVALATVFFKVNPLTAIGWMLLIVSLDFYATCVGAFIHISVSVNAGTILKNLVQIMFIYFGLLPDIAIIVIGFVLKALPIALPICALINLGIGTLFLGLTPAFMDVKEKAPKIT